MTAKHHTVLVVDDDCAIRESLVEILSDEGFEVIAVGDGDQALRWLRTRPHDACVVLLDLMPVMSGLEFLDIKEKEPAISGLPVVVITTGGECAKVLRGHTILKCMPKPFSIPALLLAVEGCRSDMGPDCPPRHRCLMIKLARTPASAPVVSRLTAVRREITTALDRPGAGMGQRTAVALRAALRLIDAVLEHDSAVLHEEVLRMAYEALQQHVYH